MAVYVPVLHECVALTDLVKVVHVDSFFKEIEAVEKLGVNTKGRIFISDRCHVVLDLHQSVSCTHTGDKTS